MFSMNMCVFIFIKNYYTVKIQLIKPRILILFVKYFVKCGFSNFNYYVSILLTDVFRILMEVPLWTYF